MITNIINRPIALDLPAIKSVFHGKESYSEPVHMYSTFDIQNAILDFEDLLDNWDGLGAYAPSGSTIHNALRFIELLPDKIVELIEQDDITCTSHGTVVIDIGNRDKTLSVEIGDHSLGYFYESSDRILLKKENQIFNQYYLSDELGKITQIIQE